MRRRQGDVAAESQTVLFETQRRETKRGEGLVSFPPFGLPVPARYRAVAV